MNRPLAPFRQVELIRAIRAAEKAKCVVRSADIMADGSIRLTFDVGGAQDNMSALDKWEAENARHDTRQGRSSR